MTPAQFTLDDIYAYAKSQRPDWVPDFATDSHMAGLFAGMLANLLNGIESPEACAKRIRLAAQYAKTVNRG